LLLKKLSFFVDFVFFSLSFFQKIGFLNIAENRKISFCWTVSKNIISFLIRFFFARFFKLLKKGTQKI